MSGGGVEGAPPAGGPASGDARLFSLFTRVYREVKASTREVRPTDRLIDDLSLDSADVLEMLFLVEDATGVDLADQAADQLNEVTTVGELIEVIRPLFV